MFKRWCSYPLDHRDLYSALIAGLNVFLHFLTGCEGADNASELVRTLLTDYEMSVLPSCSGSSIPELKIGIAVRQIIELVSLIVLFY